jgi:hypothetical protein
MLWGAYLGVSVYEWSFTVSVVSVCVAVSGYVAEYGDVYVGVCLALCTCVLVSGHLMNEMPQTAHHPLGLPFME